MSKPFAKGAGKFALVGGLTGTGGLGTSVAVREHDKDVSNQIAASTAGGWAGQGVYQGAGYGAKWRAQAKHEPRSTKNRRNKLLKPVKAEHGYYTPAMERNYPKSLPEWRTHRALGWTHRGRTGTALGTAITLGGTYAGARVVQPKEKSKRGTLVKKNDYQPGVQTTRLSPLRATEAAAGITLLGWGGSRLGIVRATLAAGTRKPGNAGINFARAEKARKKIHDVTGRGAAMIGSQTNTGFRLRPIEGAVGGTLLMNHAMPVRQKKFLPTQQGGY